MADQNRRPLDAAQVADQQVPVDELISRNGALWWLQSDPSRSGIKRLVRWTAATGVEVQTPVDLPVGSWLHAYGGGNYAVGQQELWIAGADDSKIHRLDLRTGCQVGLATEDDFAYGDLHAAEGHILAVRGTDDGDQIIEIDPVDHRIRVLVRSPGFLAAPRLHGRALAYLEWDDDRMPWDSSTLHLAEYHSQGEIGPAKALAGGPDESIVQPWWGPDGTLHYLSDRTGWWNLYRWQDGRPHPLAPMQRDCAPAPWEGGYQSYAMLADGRIALTVHHGLRSTVSVLAPDGRIDVVPSDLTSVKPYLAAAGQQLAVIAATATTAPAVSLLDLASGQLRAVPATARRAATPVAAPRLQFLQRDSDEIHYLLHLPAKPTGGSMPLLVRAHPGPTDDVPQRLDWTVQFFVSHGFAVAEVAYRGSTGQGRVFRQALDGHWGEYDVQDCADVARVLVADGTARPSAVFLTGASAGGYTALQAACRADSPFTAVTATSAITDPARWTTTAPRFQRPHAAALAGPTGAVHAEDVRIPVLLIHGTADTIASASETLDLAEGLAARGAPHQTLFLDGVGHYLSDPASLGDALETELAFYARFIGAPK
jgi:dipeptidyl aminopeptidase/acylaminoacyl peptidase